MAEPALASGAQAALSACQAELWAFGSADRALWGMEVSSLARLDGFRPSSSPGFSVIVRAGWSGDLAVAAWYLRNLSPLLPLAAVTPKPQGTFQLEIASFCEGLGIRLLDDDLVRDDLSGVGELEVAARFEFSNEFEMSNLMLRHLGERPSGVRELYPWEWMFDRALPPIEKAAVALALGCHAGRPEQVFVISQLPPSAVRSSSPTGQRAVQG